VLDGKYYQVLNHALKGTDKEGRQTSINLLDMIKHIVDAIIDCDNSSDRPHAPCWTTINQLTTWLNKSALWTESGSKIDIDPYSVITKALGFIAYYSTPHAHFGLYVFAADPDDYLADVDEYNEIFIALITEDWQNGSGDYDDFDGKMAHARTKIDLTIEDISLNYDKVDLRLKPPGWMTVKKDLEDCVVYWFEANGYVPHTGNSSRVPPCGPCPPAYPPAKLLPQPKAFPLNPSGQIRRAPRARGDPIRPSNVNQVAQYVASATEESEAAPSPTSAGASHSQIDTLGKCNFDNPPQPIMFDAKAHESMQICQLEAYVLTQYGVSSWRNMDAIVPVCPSGHVLNHIQITGLNNSSKPTTSCCICREPLVVYSHAYSCFRCVSAYFCKLPVDKVLVSAGLSKGTLFCTKCAFHSDFVDKMPVQHTAALMTV